MLKRIATASIVLTFVVSGAAFAATLSTGTKVTLHSTSHGKVLATSKGRTLYLYTSDSKNHSNCTGSCASVWPPLMTKGKPVAGTGVSQAKLGTIKRPDHGVQVTYNGNALYLFASDSKPGVASGQNVAHFHVVVVKANAATTAPVAATTTTASGGYG